MKYTNKWVVVPFSSLDKKITNNANIADQILQNKSLSKEEKIASYNNYIIRKLRKQKFKKQQEQTNDDDDIDNTNDK